MKKTIKWIFLFVLIGMPVSIYFFLQAFGENKFEIPIFYEDGIEQRVDDCAQVISQYYVPKLSNQEDSVGKDSLKILIYNIGQVESKDHLKKSNRLLILREKLKHRPQAKVFSSNKKGTGMLDFVRCGLNLEVSANTDSTINNNMIVLVDIQRRIRGYYDVLDREDMDRLIVELDILLNE